MAQTDIFGIENVSKYIELTKFSKWTIYNVNQNGNNVPLFDCNDSNSNSNAVAMFENMANILNNNTAYKIVCYNEVEIKLDRAGNEKATAKNTKSGKCSITFALSNIIDNNFSKGSNNIQQNNSNIDLASFRKEIIKEISEKNEQNEILNEIRSLKMRLNELDQEADDDDEPEQENGIAGIKPDQIAQIMGLVNMFKNSPNPSLNGITEINPDEQKININKALRILLKNDPQLDTDLLKLAELSETKKDTFNMLLSTLRSM